MNEWVVLIGSWLWGSWKAPETVGVATEATESTTCNNIFLEESDLYLWATAKLQQ